MASRTFDVVIIGGGPGGYVAAIRAAQLGKKVALVERDKLGGICLNWGCIPTKALLRSAEVLEDLRGAEQYGLAAREVNADFKAVIKRSREVAERMRKGVAFLMKKNGVEVVKGNAALDGFATRIRVTDNAGKLVETLLTTFTVISTGARPVELPFAPFDGKRIVSSKEAMILPKQPRRLVVIGAGAIGMEFAWFYNTLGAEVTIIEAMDQLLPLEDQDSARIVTREFKKRGIKPLVGARVQAVEKKRGGVKVRATVGEKESEFEADVVLVAVGVRGNVENLGLDEVGVRHDKRFIQVDEFCRASVPGVYAIGDVTGPPMLAHVASHQGILAVEHLCGLEPAPLDMSSVPACTYCQPQVASMGLTEKAARDAGHEVRVGTFPFTASGKAVALGHTAGHVKLVFDAGYGELLGAHAVGREATELLAETVLARTHGATPESILHTIHAHPTLSEAVMEAAAAALGEAIHM